MTREELFAIDPVSGEEATTYSVHLEKFEGPLDLLLYLIRKNEIDIYDIPIAKITSQYLEYIDLMRLLDLDVAGEFIMMAATLIRVKSKLLLPRPEDELEEDPREELILALLEYKKFKEAAGILKSHETRERDVLKHSDFSFVDTKPSEEFLIEATIFDLVSVFRRVIEEYGHEASHRVSREDVKVEEQMERILSLLNEKDGVAFRDLFTERPFKLLIIATFIAVLELVKQNCIYARQAREFGEIRLFAREGSHGIS
jgi:segregation and condensation protein A